MSVDVHIECNTRFADWAGGSVPATALDVLAELGLVGPAGWAQYNWRGAKHELSVPVAPGFGRRVVDLLPARSAERVRALEVGGHNPSWYASLIVSPYDATSGELASMNVLAVSVSAEPNDDGRVRAAFRALVDQGSIEYAFAHPFDSYRRLTARVARDPIFTSMQLPCMLWTNYVGPTIVRQFEVPERGTLDGFELTWHASGGVLLMAEEGLSAAGSEASEERLLALTDAVRKWRRPQG